MRYFVSSREGLGLCILEKELSIIKDKSFLEDTLLYEQSGEEFKIPVKINLSKKRELYLKTNFSGLSSFVKQDLVIDLNKEALKILTAGEGLIASLTSDYHIDNPNLYIYSPKYQYFDIIYKNAEASIFKKMK